MTTACFQRETECFFFETESLLKERFCGLLECTVYALRDNPFCLDGDCQSRQESSDVFEWGLPIMIDISFLEDNHALKLRATVKAEGKWV